VDTRGGEPVQLTSHPAEDGSPEWSKDGRWIYFGSLRSGSSQIWRIPAAGGPAIQITKNGGARPRLSRDGSAIYYAKFPVVPTAIWRVAIEGGLETEILGSGAEVDQFAPAEGGIYYIPVAMPPDSLELRFRDLETSADEKIATLQAVSLNCSRCMDWNESGLSVSPDGRTILFGKVDAFDADLMLIEDFR
jgi:Tol biopolymer transport system component